MAVKARWLWLIPFLLAAVGTVLARSGAGRAVPGYEILAESYWDGTTPEGQPARVGTLTVLVAPRTSSAGVEAVMADLVERVTAARGPLSGLEVYFLDTRE